MNQLLKIIGCDSLESCRRIQRGHIFLRRIAKWAMLYTIAITLIIDDIFTKLIDTINAQYGKVQQLYREEVYSPYNIKYWFSWPPPLPDLDQKMINLYNNINFAQSLIFIVILAYSLRWTYADCQVQGNKPISFGDLLARAAITNVVTYVTLRILIAIYFG